MTEFFHLHTAAFAQGFGFAAMLTAIITYQCKKHRTIMLLIILTSLLWCCHYACLGLMTPIAMNFLNVIRNSVYSFRDRKWAQTKAIPAAFIAVSLVMTVLTWANAWSLLPFVASIFAIIGQWQTDTRRLKLLTIPLSACWWVYNFVNHSWAGMCNETFVLCSIAVSLLRLRAERKKECGEEK